MKPEQINELILGVVNDFGGFLTTEPDTLITGAIHDAAPMVGKIRNFLKLRKIETNNIECDLKWENKCLQRSDRE